MGGMTPGSWARTTLALAVLFGSLPVVGRVLFGTWGFAESAAIGGLCLMASVYLRIRERRRMTLPDDAAALEAALGLAWHGRDEEADVLLNRLLRLSPRFWQARQLRGELRLRQPGGAARAALEFSEAIALAPGEAHLRILRGHAYLLSGNDAAAVRDFETAELLGAAVAARAPIMGSYLGIPDSSTFKEETENGGNL